MNAGLDSTLPTVLSTACLRWGIQGRQVLRRWMSPVNREQWNTVRNSIQHSLPTDTSLTCRSWLNCVQSLWGLSSFKLSIHLTSTVQVYWTLDSKKMFSSLLLMCHALEEGSRCVEGKAINCSISQEMCSAPAFCSRQWVWLIICTILNSRNGFCCYLQINRLEQLPRLVSWEFTRIDTSLKSNLCFKPWVTGQFCLASALYNE